VKLHRGSLSASAITLFLIGVIIGGCASYIISYHAEDNGNTDAGVEDEISSLHSLISDMEKEIADYISTIPSLEAEKSNRIRKITTLEATLKDANQTINNKQNEIDNLTSLILCLDEEKREYESEISQLEIYLKEAENTLKEYKEGSSKLKSQISNLESENAILNEELDSFVSEISSLNALMSSYKSELYNLRTQLDSKDDELSELESRMNRILGIDVTQHYEWVYGSWMWSNRYEWNLRIPLPLYIEYNERPRPDSWREWVEMARDVGDDSLINEMIRQINSDAISKGFTEIEKVNFVIAFVQSLPYTEDRVSTPWNEYPRYPIETLFDRGGDCEDTSILVAALLDRMGYDVALLFLSGEKHCAVGVSIEGAHGSYYSIGAKKYFYLETTGEGWRIGEIPPDFTDTRANIFPV